MLNDLIQLIRTENDYIKSLPPGEALFNVAYLSVRTAIFVILVITIIEGGF